LTQQVSLAVFSASMRLLPMEATGRPNVFQSPPKMDISITFVHLSGHFQPPLMTI
jgi:hypothetical protein